MKSQVKIITMLVFLLVSWGISCNTSVRVEKIPVTTESENARSLYERALEFFEKVYIPQAMDLFEGALAEDPDFFMAAYYLAIYNLYFERDEEFARYAGQAVQSVYKLSKGEELLKTALQNLLKDPRADVIETGELLVKLYPNDPEAYLKLSFFQQLLDDYQGQVETLLKATEIKEDPAFIYNSLAYTYMALMQYEDAELALDKYLQLKPDEPNPYDSKGDYFMAVEEYGKAYDSFMMAVKIDTTWTSSLRKAIEAKSLIE